MQSGTRRFKPHLIKYGKIPHLIKTLNQTSLLPPHRKASKSRWRRVHSGSGLSPLILRTMTSNAMSAIHIAQVPSRKADARMA